MPNDLSRVSVASSAFSIEGKRRNTAFGRLTNILRINWFEILHLALVQIIVEAIVMCFLKSI